MYTLSSGRRLDTIEKRIAGVSAAEPVKYFASL
jgi:hypothetical protein